MTPSAQCKLSGRSTADHQGFGHPQRHDEEAPGPGAGGRRIEGGTSLLAGGSHPVSQELEYSTRRTNMSPTMLEIMTAREIMQPLPCAVTPQTLAAEALEVMRREDVHFLPVVAADSERFLGVVLRRALELGCAEIGHRASECAVVSHLKADVDFCLHSEPADEVVQDTSAAEEHAAGRHNSRTRTRLRLPVIVVDENKVPVGMIERNHA
jgi:CBS domain-containing protein